MTDGSAPPPMIQKKICLVGAFAVGKSSLVRRFVHSIFSDTYLTTVGIRIDRKDVRVGAQVVRLLLWDLAGEDEQGPLQQTYLRGAAACVIVGDLTRSETVDRVVDLRGLCERTIGPVPTAVLLNKSDLTDERQVEPERIDTVAHDTVFARETSAKTGDGVEDCFVSLAEAVLRP